MNKLKHIKPVDEDIILSLKSKVDILMLSNNNNKELSDKYIILNNTVQLMQSAINDLQKKGVDNLELTKLIKDMSTTLSALWTVNDRLIKLEKSLEDINNNGGSGNWLPDDYDQLKAYVTDLQNRTDNLETWLFELSVKLDEMSVWNISSTIAELKDTVSKLNDTNVQ